MPDETTLSVLGGDTFVCVFEWTDSAGDPINLEGYGLTFTVWNAAGDVLLEADNGDIGGIEVNMTAGEMTVTLQTQDVETGCHSYTMVAVSGGGMISTLGKGIFSIAE